MKLKKILWILLLIGLTLNIAQLIIGYISISLFFRFSLIFLAFFILNFLLRNFKNIYSKIFNIFLIALLSLSIYFNIGYFNRIDLFVIVIPKNYDGKISIGINNPASKIEVIPQDRILTIELNNNGSFSTNSYFEMEFNSIIVMEKDENRKKPRKLELSSKKLEFIKDSKSTSYLIFTANVESK